MSCRVPGTVEEVKASSWGMTSSRGLDARGEGAEKGCFSLDTHCSLSIVLKSVSSSQPLRVSQMRDLMAERFSDLLRS